MKVLVLDECIIREKCFFGFHAFEGDINDNSTIEALSKIHGIDHTHPTTEMQKAIDKYLSILYNVENGKIININDPWKEVIHTDKILTKNQLGPYERVFHIIY